MWIFRIVGTLGFLGFLLEFLDFHWIFGFFVWNFFDFFFMNFPEMCTGYFGVIFPTKQAKNVFDVLCIAEGKVLS